MLEFMEVVWETFKEEISKVSIEVCGIVLQLLCCTEKENK